MPKFIDMTGERFGKWTVIKLAEPKIDKRGNNVHMWLCKCDCCVERNVSGTSLRSGKSTSCGCDPGKRAETAKKLFSTNNESKTRLYKIWAYMRKRCYNKNASNYADYGGRGITVCDMWNDNYITFRDWAVSNGYNDTLSIDRIDVNGNYTPDNCRWVTGVAQANNRRNTVFYTYNGETKSVAEWARLYGVNYKTLLKRVKSGKQFPEAINA